MDMLENIKERNNSAIKDISSIKGSRYFYDIFKSSQVEYFVKTLKDNIYLRYNAFSDEMEMGKTANQNSSEEILIKNNKVACVIEGDTYRYLGYINENEAPAVGYVKELFKGAVFSFYIRQTLSLIHISEPTRQAEISYAVFCLKKKKKKAHNNHRTILSPNLHTITNTQTSIVYRNITLLHHI